MDERETLPSDSRALKAPKQFQRGRARTPYERTGILNRVKESVKDFFSPSWFLDLLKTNSENADKFVQTGEGAVPHASSSGDSTSDDSDAKQARCQSEAVNFRPGSLVCDDREAEDQRHNAEDEKSVQSGRRTQQHDLECRGSPLWEQQMHTSHKETVVSEELREATIDHSTRSPFRSNVEREAEAKPRHHDAEEATPPAPMWAPMSFTSSVADSTWMSERSHIAAAAYARSSTGRRSFSSPFYSGRTAFGGQSSAHRPFVAKRRHASSPGSPESLPAKQRFQPRLSAGVMSSGDTAVTSQTAKRILGTLERMSSPLQDAQKAARVSHSPLSFTPSLQYSKTSTLSKGIFRRQSTLQRKLPGGPPSEALTFATSAVHFQPIARKHDDEDEEPAHTAVQSEPNASSAAAPRALSFPAIDSSAIKAVQPADPAGFSFGLRRDDGKTSTPLPILARSQPTTTEKQPQFDAPSGGGKMKSSRSLNHYRKQEDAPSQGPLSFKPQVTSSPPSAMSSSSSLLKQLQPRTSTPTPQSGSRKKSDKRNTAEEEVTSQEMGKETSLSNVAFQFAAPSPKKRALSKVSSSKSVNSQVQFNFSHPRARRKSQAEDGKVDESASALKSLASAADSASTESPDTESPGLLKSSAHSSSQLASSTSSGNTGPSAGSMLSMSFGKKPGQWSCSSCMVANDSSKETCVCCSAAKPTSNKPTEQKDDLSSSAEVTSVKALSSSAYTSSDKPSLNALFGKKPGQWTCDSCMLTNDVNKDKCVSCSSSKPGAKTASTTSTPAGVPSITVTQQPSLASLFGKKPGQWTCDACMVTNEEDKDKCVSCGTANPSAGKKSTAPASEPPSGQPSLGSLFGKKSGQWSCPTCMVDNDGDKVKCVACSEQKPGAPASASSSALSAGGVTFGLPGTSTSFSSSGGVKLNGFGGGLQFGLAGSGTKSTTADKSVGAEPGGGVGGKSGITGGEGVGGKSGITGGGVGGKSGITGGFKLDSSVSGFTFGTSDSNMSGGLKLGSGESGGLKLGGSELGGLKLGISGSGGVKFGGNGSGGLKLGINESGGLKLGGSESGGLKPGINESGGLKLGCSESGGLKPGSSELGGLKLGGSEPGGLKLGNSESGELKLGSGELGLKPGGSEPGGLKLGNSESRGLKLGSGESGLKLGGSESGVKLGSSDSGGPKLGSSDSGALKLNSGDSKSTSFGGFKIGNTPGGFSFGSSSLEAGSLTQSSDQKPASGGMKFGDGGFKIAESASGRIGFKASDNGGDGALKPPSNSSSSQTAAPAKKSMADLAAEGLLTVGVLKPPQPVAAVSADKPAEVSVSVPSDSTKASSSLFMFGSSSVNQAAPSFGSGVGLGGGSAGQDSASLFKFSAPVAITSAATTAAVPSFILGASATSSESTTKLPFGSASAASEQPSKNIFQLGVQSTGSKPSIGGSSLLPFSTTPATSSSASNAASLTTFQFSGSGSKTDAAAATFNFTGRSIGSGLGQVGSSTTQAPVAPTGASIPFDSTADAKSFQFSAGGNSADPSTTSTNMFQFSGGSQFPSASPATFNFTGASSTPASNNSTGVAGTGAMDSAAPFVFSGQSAPAVAPGFSFPFGASNPSSSGTFQFGGSGSSNSSAVGGVGVADVAFGQTQNELPMPGAMFTTGAAPQQQGRRPYKRAMCRKSASFHPFGQTQSKSPMPGAMYTTGAAPQQQGRRLYKRAVRRKR